MESFEKILKFEYTVLPSGFKLKRLRISNFVDEAPIIWETSRTVFCKSTVESHTEAKLTEFLAQLKDYSIFRSKIIYFIPSKPSASPEKQSFLIKRD